LATTALFYGPLSHALGSGSELPMARTVMKFATSSSDAMYWLQEFHIDALRLDAIHGIFDASAFPFLAELSTAVNSLSADLGRRVHLIAETI